MKLTPTQREILRKMAEGWILHWMSGTRCAPSSWLVYRERMQDRQTVRGDTLDKFYKAKWIEITSDPVMAWRSSTYRITEAGRKAIGLQ